MSRLTRTLLTLDAALRVGLGNAASVALYRAMMKRGRLARPAVEIDGHLYRSTSTPDGSVAPTSGLLGEAEDLTRGDLLAFGGQSLHAGAPPDWRLNLLNGARVEDDRPWWRISDDDPDAGDIKGVWEASRWDWALTLARASIATGDPRWAGLLREWSADWLGENPQFLGPNWRCGQEASIRLLQAMLAARLLGQDRAPAQGLPAFVDASLRRIGPTRFYAMAQDNNHGVSEAAAMFAGGAWLARNGDAAQAAKGRRWAAKGRRWLNQRARRLIFHDGGFSQYSVNYHRLALDTLVQAELWRRRLGERSFSDAFYDRAAAAARWLVAVTNPVTGDAPNLGANDGAHAFRMDDGPFRDHRPSAQLASAVFLDASAFPPGPWDAPLAALGLAPPPLDPALSSLRHRHFPDFGLSLLAPVDGSAYAFVRTPRGRFRPQQADPLHFDLWTRNGRNLLRDGGSFSYADRGADAAFAGIGAHNTVQFDNRDAMPRLSRFLYARWLNASSRAPRDMPDGRVTWSCDYHDAFGAAHRREVIGRGDSWIIHDQLHGRYGSFVLRWRLPEGDWVLEHGKVSGSGMTLTVEADDGPLALDLRPGLESLRYGEATPCLVLEARGGAPTARLRTVVTVG